MGQVVVVTGASSGVGRALARELGARRARVALIARNQEALTHAAQEVRAGGGEALILPLDVADARAVDVAADAVVAEWGRIDVWINNAMVSVLAPALEMTAEEFRRVTEVTYLGYVHGTLAAVRRMRSLGGLVLQVGSALTYRSIPLQSAYCAAKAAIRGFTDSLRSELLHDRVPVELCMVQLPAVNTPQFEVVRTRMPKEPMPVPPAYQPELIAREILRAALRPKREVWLGWSTVKAIMGQFLAPGFADWFLARRGYSGQQTDSPSKPGRADNLLRPVPGDRGAHGPFDSMAKERSLEMWLAAHRGLLAGCLLVSGLAVAGVRRWSA